MNVLSKDKISALYSCFRNSKGVRAAAREVGVHQNTAARYLRHWERVIRQGNLQRCACGQHLRHQGFCSVRFKRSEARQEFMNRWRKETHA